MPKGRTLYGWSIALRWIRKKPSHQSICGEGGQPGLKFSLKSSYLLLTWAVGSISNHKSLHEWFVSLGIGATLVVRVLVITIKVAFSFDQFERTEIPVVFETFSFLSYDITSPIWFKIFPIEAS